MFLLEFGHFFRIESITFYQLIGNTDSLRKETAKIPEISLLDFVFRD